MVVAAVAFVDVVRLVSISVNAVQFGNYDFRVWPSKKLRCSALTCSTKLGLVAGIARARRMGA
jgi:hypothetical protein